MGTHPGPSVLPKSGAEGGRTSIPTSAATSPVAAAVTRQLDAASPRPVTNPGTMGRRCNPHLTCHMERAQAAAVARLLDAASPHPVTNPGTMGGAAPVPQALQHSFSAAASIAALLRCRTVAVLELQLLHCSLRQSAPVPLPIQGLWGGCCLPLHPPHGGAQGRRAVHSRPASQMRCAWAQRRRSRGQVSSPPRRGPGRAVHRGCRGSAARLSQAAAAARRVPGPQSCP